MKPSDNYPDNGKILNIADARAVNVLVRQTIFQLWGVVENLARLHSRHHRYRVSIFGSARVPPEDPIYADARRLAQELAAMGCCIVTGGGAGLMEAANEGATQGGDDGQSIGVCIDGEICGHPNPFVRRSHIHHTFFSRLHHFVHISDAFVALPGGVGTLMETLMVWQLIQARKLHGTPLILVGRMWSELLDWTRTHMLDAEVPFLEAADLTIPVCVPGVDGALELIRQHRQEWDRSSNQ